MNKILFEVQGSATDPYTVEFVKNGDNFSAFCSCPAGKHGMYCKHRIRIMSGTTKGIVSNNLSDIQTILQWLKGSEIEKIANEICEAQTDLEKAKRKVASLKKKFARILVE
jgi:uncharacterized Zn finger protein